MSETNIVLACQGLQKIYRQGTRAAFEVPVLMGVDMEIMAGERVAELKTRGYENAGLYEASARLHWDSTLDLFRRESQVPALRGILQIALKDEPWFETKRNMEAEAIRIKPQA